MSSIEKISVALPPEMVSLVRGAVEAGEYASSSEVIREALRDWSQKRTLRAEALEQMRCLWRQAAEDPSPGIDPEPVLAKLESKYKAMAEASEAQRECA